MYRFTLMFVFFACEKVLALSVDQRQTGDLNVQIDLKNLNIIALTKGKEEYVDYDYAYDYSEMTIKPQNGTTSTTIKPLNATETAQIDKNNVTTPAIIESTQLLGSNETDSTTTESVMATNVSTSTAATSTVRLETITEATTTADNQTTATVLECKKGFFRNNKGNCELKLQNPSITLLKMLQQKSNKSSGGNVVRKS